MLRKWPCLLFLINNSWEYTVRDTICISSSFRCGFSTWSWNFLYSLKYGTLKVSSLESLEKSLEWFVRLGPFSKSKGRGVFYRVGDTDPWQTLLSSGLVWRRTSWTVCPTRAVSLHTGSSSPHSRDFTQHLSRLIVSPTVVLKHCNRRFSTLFYISSFRFPIR